MRSRVLRIFEQMPDDIDRVLLMNHTEPHVDLSFFHATDLVAGGTFERAAAVLTREGAAHILVPALEESSARRAKDAVVTTFREREEREKWLRAELAGAAKIGLHLDELAASDYVALAHTLPKAERVDVTQGLAAARAIKDEVEVGRIRTAGRIVSEVADMVPELLSEGMREFELAAELSYQMQKRGATGPSFDSIVAFGAGSAEPHYHPGDIVLQDGFVLCDFGAWFQRYASDLTRTWLHGEVEGQHRAIYAKVKEAHQAALDKVKAGVNGKLVHQAAADVIDASPFKGRFIHSVGHGLGLAVHDGGVLSPRVDYELQAGMVVTIEPGIYVPEVGGVRIEDDILVTDDGYELLTAAKYQTA